MIENQDLIDKLDDLKGSVMLLRGLGKVTNEMDHPDTQKAFYLLIEKLEDTTNELETYLQKEKN